MMATSNQGRLTLVRGGLASQTISPSQNQIAELTADLIRFPTRGGVDYQEPALTYLAEWLEQYGVPVRILEASNRKPKNRPLGLLAEIGPAQGPVFCLTACLDTALFGSADTWDGRNPTAATLTEDGWLIGRGSADSKVGVSIFSTLIAELKQRESRLNGRLLLLIDSDEHTGRFGAVKALVQEYKRIHGAYIGYPGSDTIKVGARGFYRGKVSLYGLSSHTGARAPSTQNAVEKAACLVRILQEHELPSLQSDSSFGIGPQKTCTAISGGRGYSNVPDYCFLRVDYRLTPAFTVALAREHLREAVERVDAEMATVRASRIEAEQSWPAYRLREDIPLVRALCTAAAQEIGRRPRLSVSGPSNVGNYLSSVGIDATCGFGVTHRNIHAAKEAIRVDSIMPVYRSYRSAVLDLL